MRLLFVLTASTVIAAWFVWFFVRPKHPLRAKQLFIALGMIAALLIGGFIRLL